MRRGGKGRLSIVVGAVMLNDDLGRDDDEKKIDFWL